MNINKYVNPIYMFVLLSGILYLLLNLHYKYYIYIDMSGFAYYFILLNLLFVVLGMSIANIKYSVPLLKKYNYNLKYKKYFIQILSVITIIGFLSTFIKMFIVFRNFGLPTSPEFFIQSRLAFLRGDFYFPFLFQAGSILLFPSLACFLLLYKFKKIKSAKIIFLITLMIVINDLLIGGRGNIAFTFMYILIFNLFYDKFYGNNISYLKKIILMLFLVIGIFIFLNIIREGSDLYKAWEQLISYIIGPFFATFYDLGSLIESHERTYGFYTFGGIARFIFTQIKTDFGYVPIYKNLDFGFNSFLYISYITRDFGFVGCLIYSFLIGIITQYLYISLKRNFKLVKFLIFINLMLLLVLFFRDTVTKWVSWWSVIVTIFIIIIGGVKIEKNNIS